MKREFDLSGVRVHIGVPAYADLAPQTSLALTATCIALLNEGIGFGMSVKWGNCYVDQVRSIIAHEFLQGPAEFLFHIDADMIWEPRDFLQVLAHTTKMDAVSVAYRMKDEKELYTVCLPDPIEVNEYGCTPMNGGGLGFCCVQRKVIEALAKKAEKIKMGVLPEVPFLYRCRVKDQTYQGEDMAFFEDMRAAGFQPHVDLGLTVDHLGRKVYRGSLADALEYNQKHSAEFQKMMEPDLGELAAIP